MTGGDRTVAKWRVGDCLALADGRIGRLREASGRTCRVRVRRKTSATHQFREVLKWR